MANKVIDPAPIIKQLADRCLKSKGLECSVLGSVIDLLKAAPAVDDAPYWATERAYKNGYEAGKKEIGDKWIPTVERLPDFEIERVLVTINRNLVLGFPKMDTDRCINGRWVRYGDNVTHWMPLPEAPEEGKE